MLTVRDENGVEQTLRVTEEHPFFVAEAGWTPARKLAAGDSIVGAEGTLTVSSNEHEPHPQGVTVYNLEVERAHTYFVLAENAADAAAVWVHNATYAGTGPRTDNRFGHNRRIREVARTLPTGHKVLAGGRAFDGKYRPEAVVETLGGLKPTRRPDLLVQRPDGSKYGINIGLLDANGLPIKRELNALYDLSIFGGLEMQFHSYQRRR